MKNTWWGDAPQDATVFFDRQCLYGKYHGDQLMILNVVRNEWAPIKNIRYGAWSKSIRPSPCVHCGILQNSDKEKSEHEKKCEESSFLKSWTDDNPKNWLSQNPWGAK